MVCAERGDNRKTTVDAISSGVVIRCPSGMRAVMAVERGLRIGKAAQPLSIERRHHLGGDDSVHADAGWQQLHGPLARERENAALRCRISRRAALSRHRHFRRDVHDRATRLLQCRQRVMRDGVDVDEIAGK